MCAVVTYNQCMHCYILYYKYCTLFQQISPEELTSDADHIFSIAMCDPEFEGLMKEIDHHQARDAVYEALKVLQTTPEPDVNAERIEFIDLSAEVSNGVI